MEVERNGRKVTLRGSIGSSADLAEVTRIASDIESIDLGELVRINSSGVAAWVGFAQALSSPLTLHNCPVFFIEQANVIHGFLQNLSVASVEVPFFCDTTDEEISRIYPVNELREGLPHSIEVDGNEVNLDIDESYFAFLHQESA